MSKKTKRKSKLVTREKTYKTTTGITYHKRTPKIVVKDIELSPNYYRTTEVKLENKDKFYINWNTKEDFKKGLAKLQRHYNFNQQDIIDVNTKTHRYASTSFTAKGFKP